jgi:hypothetical protein
MMIDSKSDIGGLEMDELDSRVYYGVKDSLRKAIKNISEENLKWNNMPIILIDFHSWDVFYFEDEYQAKDFIQENHTTGWDEPPSGEDENLILYKFCTEEEKNRLEYTHRDYEFFKEVNGKKIYREKSFVEFEPELVINVCI